MIQNHWKFLQGVLKLVELSALASFKNLVFDIYNTCTWLEASGFCQYYYWLCKLLTLLNLVRVGIYLSRSINLTSNTCLLAQLRGNTIDPDISDQRNWKVPNFFKWFTNFKINVDMNSWIVCQPSMASVWSSPCNQSIWRCTQLWSINDWC